MTEPLHQIIMILFGIITEGGNGLLVKAGGLDFTNKSRLFANPDPILPSKMSKSQEKKTTFFSKYA